MVLRGTPDNDFHYPAGYEFAVIVKENPTGLNLINKPFTVLRMFILSIRNC